MTAEEYPKVYLYRRIVQAKLYIDQHFQEHINLEMVSEEAAFSKFHFIRLFKKIYQKTPHQYLREVRLDQARQLMTQGQLDVESICLKVGFESVGSFSSLFKRKFGSPPAFYAGKLQDQLRQTRQKPLSYVPGCFAAAKGWK